MKTTKRRKKVPQKPMTISRLEGSKEAKKAAMAVLEVLAGLRKPSEAHKELGCSLQRYYAIEARAIQGLITSLENRDHRRQRRPETKIKELEKELERTTRELNRAQTLIRMAQRTVGMKAATNKLPASKKGKRRRKATVRAKKVAKVLKTKLEKQMAKPELALAGN